MTRSVKWSAGTALLVVLLFIAGWFLLISPKLAAAGEFRDQTTAQKDANLLLQRKIAALKVQAKTLPKERARLAEIAQQLPPAPALPKLLRTLDGQAKASGVVLKTLSPVVPVSAEPAAVGPVTVSPQKGAAGGGGPYLQTIALDIKVTGSFAQLEDFLNKTETIRRSILATHVTVQNVDQGDPAIKDGKLVLTDKLEMTMNSSVFIATPNPPAPATGAAAGAPPAQ